MDNIGKKTSSKWSWFDALSRLSKKEQREAKKLKASTAYKRRRSGQKRSRFEKRYHPTSLLPVEEVDPFFDYEFEDVVWGQPANFVEYDFTCSDSDCGSNSHTFKSAKQQICSTMFHKTKTTHVVQDTKLVVFDDTQVLPGLSVEECIEKKKDATLRQILIMMGYGHFGIDVGKEIGKFLGYNMHRHFELPRKKVQVVRQSRVMQVWEYGSDELALVQHLVRAFVAEYDF
jgi:hypothetical protein